MLCKTKTINMEKKFEIELKNFGREVDSCSKFLYEHLSIKVFLVQNKSALDTVNKSPEFWITTDEALHTAFFITLGRVFDKRKDSHSIFSMLKLACNNKNIFSKSALSRRKKSQINNAHEWLEENLKDVYEPSCEDFVKLWEEVSQCSKEYDASYMKIRHKFFAHKQIPEANGSYVVNTETSYCDSQKLLYRLSSLHVALCKLFYDGMKPDLHKMEPRELKFIQKSTRYWMEMLLRIPVASGLSS